MTGPQDFEGIVDQYYGALYRFALSLTRNENDACDLTQQTIYVWATKGRQLHDPSKVKSWLFTTLHRLFLERRRRFIRFPHHELEEVLNELPAVHLDLVSRLDSSAVVDLLHRIDPIFQAPVALFYLEDCSYKDIARILRIPMGTVKSRLARGLAQLQAAILNPRRSPPNSTTESRAHRETSDSTPALAEPSLAPNPQRNPRPDSR